MRKCPYCRKKTAKKIKNTYICSNCGSEFKNSELNLLHDTEYLDSKRKYVILMESVPIGR